MSFFVSQRLRTVKRKRIRAAFTLFILALLMVVLSCFTGNCTAFAAIFSDLKNHWAAGEIQKAVARGYVKGYPDGTFKPDRRVTRAEFVTLLNGAFQIKGTQGVALPYRDVKEGDWFAKELRAALEAGYLKDFSEGVFLPQQAATREEVAYLAGKLLGLEKTASLNFSDASAISSRSRPYVAMLVAYGVIRGYPDGSFRPARIVTRAEAIVIINKALDVKQQQRVITPVSLYLQVKGDIVNIRSGPGTDQSIVGQVKEGDVFKASALSDNNWYKVEFQGKTGWIAGWLVETYQTPPPSRDDPGTLEVKVERKNSGVTVKVLGSGRGEFSWEEKDDPYRLVIYIPGITVVRSSMEINVKDAGLEKVTTRFPADASTTAQVELWFQELPVMPDYLIDSSKNGELSVNVPYQIYGVDEEQDGDSLTLTLQGTAPLIYKSFTLSNPKRLVLDFPGFLLNYSLLKWENAVDLPGVSSVRLGQFQESTARIVVEYTKGISLTDRSYSSGKKLVLNFKPMEAKGKLVVLDPGHGGSDPGAIGPTGVKEKDVNLAIAYAAAEVLQKNGVDVVLTRYGDEDLGLAARSEIANSRGADAFVSIHSNASYNSSIGGTGTYTYAPFGSSLGMQRDVRLNLARMLQNKLVQNLGLRDAGIFEENFAVLRYSSVPAALVEVAFISNPAEEQLLADPDFQKRAGEAIAQGIMGFLGG